MQGLGPVTRLEVTWEAPSAGPAAAQLAAKAAVRVRVEESAVITTAALEVEVRGGRSPEWALLLPPDAEVSVADSPTAVTAPAVLRPDAKNPFWRVQLRDPATERLRLDVTTRQPRAAGPGPYPVGPFAVRGAVQQTGQVQITAPKTLRVLPKPAAELQRQPDEPGGDVVYTYDGLPTPGAGPAPPLLTLTVEPARG